MALMFASECRLCTGIGAGAARPINTRRSRPRHEVEVVAVVEEQLRDEEVGAGVNLEFHVAELVVEIRALRMLLGAACGADSEAVAVAAHECDQVAAVR